MPGGFPDPEQFVIDFWNRFDRSRRESERGKLSMGGVKIFDHQVEARVAGDHLAFFDQDQVRASAKFKHRDTRTRMYCAHADRAHECRGFFQPVRFQDDMPDPDRWSQTFAIHPAGTGYQSCSESVTFSG